MLITLMFVNVIAGIQTTSQADPDIELNILVSTEPQWGVFGGYHDIIDAIKVELAKIGINLVIHYFDPSVVSDITYAFWDVPGVPPDGCDMSPG